MRRNDTGFWGPEALPCLGRQGGVNRNNDSYNTKGVIHIKGRTKHTVTILRLRASVRVDFLIKVAR